MPSVPSIWPGLGGPPPNEDLLELAGRLTGALSELEVIRLLAEEVEARVRPSHWVLLVGDRETVRVEHVGGKAAPSLLRRVHPAGAGLVGRALDRLEPQLEMNPDPADLVALGAEKEAPEDAVVLPFGGFEVVGCIELVNVLRTGPSGQDIAALRRALVLGGIGIRNARRHRALSRGETVDEITGLAGPNRFRAELDQELARARRSQRPVSVLLVDLDHFKAVNEAHGRLVGSSLLAEVGAILQHTVRTVDLASRWTGDTFALLLPETDRAGALVVAGRLQSILRASQLEVLANAPLELTASVGIAVFDGPTTDPERLIREAEARMRHAQESGTDEAVVVAD